MSASSFTSAAGRDEHRARRSSSASSDSSSAHSTRAPVSPNWLPPSTEQVVNAPLKSFTHAAKSSGKVKVLDASRWLLMSAAGVIEELTIGKGSKSMKVDYIVGCFNLLLQHLGARSDTLDPARHSAVHWIIFCCLTEFNNESGKMRYRPKQEPAMLAMETGGVEPAEDELAEPHLFCQCRYRVERALELLLEKSKDDGYRGDNCEGFFSDELRNKQSLLDVQDSNGNTPLHYAVAHSRADLVGMLLSHGADIAIQNKEGLTVDDLVQWQESDDQQEDVVMKSAEDKGTEKEKKADKNLGADGFFSSSILTVADSNSSRSTSSASASSAAAHSRPGSSVYSSVTRVYERKWGTMDGLRIDQESYAGESDSAAIKRLIFQRKLALAAEDGDDGNLREVKRLVLLWKKAQKEGKKMFPLVYRADVDFFSPLQTAVSYASESTAILAQLLQLPINPHVQPARFQFAPFTLSLVSNNPRAAWMLLQAEHCPADINMRDAANGKTALHAVAEMKTMADPDSLVGDSESAYTTETYICHLTRELIERGADPNIVDANGNTPLHVAAHRGLPALISLLLQWNAKQEAGASLSSAELSSFVTAVNVFGNTALHYAFYTAHHSERHAAGLSLLLSLGLEVRSPKNRQGLSPLQLFAAFDSDVGKKICKEQLKMNMEDVQAVVEPARKIVKKKVLNKDLSNGQERFPLPVITEFEVSAADLASLSSFAYTRRNHWIHPPSDPADSMIPKLESNVTMQEALKEEKNKGKQEAAVDAHSAKKQKTGSTSSSSSLLSDEEELSNFIEADSDPAETRRILEQGIGFPLEVRMTEHKGFALFATTLIPKGSFVCEFAGEMLIPSEVTRRIRVYASKGMHPLYLQNGLVSLDCDKYAIDQLYHGSASRFIAHSCDPNLILVRVLDNTRIAIYSVCDINPGELLCTDFHFDRQQYTPGATFICNCKEDNCDRILL